jgi:hypothetical protein
MSEKVLPNELRAGDVLLFHGTGFISDMIRLFDGSDYSHAALFNGQNVVEAIGSGITARSLSESAAGAKYIDVFRFITADGKHRLGEAGYAVQPIIDTSAKFVAKADRYAYEQIILLATLAGTRRIPVVSDIPFLRWILRNILDNAAEVISNIVAAGKEPMICSELVYRCYTESGPQYDLIIRGADTLAMRARSIPLSSGSISAAALGQIHEVTAIEAELDTFIAKYEVAKHRSQKLANAKTAKPKPKGTPKVMGTNANELAALAVADFVTPRDLRDSPDLYKVGTLQA